MGKNPESLIEEAEKEKQNRGELAEEALKWFLDDDNVGEMYPRSEAAQSISEDLDIGLSRAERSIADTVGDIVDPVQQINVEADKYVGVVEYHVYPDEGAYGYVDYNDTFGQRNRVVCAKCVEEAEYDSEVTHATQGEGTASEDATWNRLLNKVTAHYTQEHSEAPSEIEPGASLVSGTTIASNTAVHGGNQSDFGVDSFGSGNLSDGDYLQNSGGSISGQPVSLLEVTSEPSDTNIWIRTDR